MNIAIFTPNQNPYSETFIQAHKKYLKGNIFYYYGRSNVSLENHPPLSSELKYGILKAFQRVANKPADYVRNSVLLNSLRKLKIDVVLIEYGIHAHNMLPVLKKSGVPFVVHFHGYDASVREIIKKHNNYKEVFQHAFKVIAVSKKMEQMLLEIDCPREKLVYNVYGPQPEFLSVKPTFSKKQFLAIGRFTDKKAPYYTILAFKGVVEKHPDAKLIMGGNGQLLNTCKNLAKYLNIEAQVEFEGVITPERYRELLSESLGFVQHSITAGNGNMEGTPLAVLEASAAGLPVISTFHAGIPDVIINGKTGLLSEEHDVNTMTENMLNLLNDVDLAKKIGDAGKENINTYFSMERHIGTLQGILESVV